MFVIFKCFLTLFLHRNVVKTLVSEKHAYYVDQNREFYIPSLQNELHLYDNLDSQPVAVVVSMVKCNLDEMTELNEHYHANDVDGADYLAYRLTFLVYLERVLHCLARLISMPADPPKAFLGLVVDPVAKARMLMDKVTEAVKNSCSLSLIKDHNFMVEKQWSSLVGHFKE